MQLYVLFESCNSCACFFNRVAKFEPILVRRNVGRSIKRGLQDLHNISTFRFYVNQMISVAEKEYLKITKKHQTSITNRKHKALIQAQYTQNYKHMTLYRKAPVTDPPMTFRRLTFWVSSIHKPSRLYKERSICVYEVSRYFFRKKSQSKNYRKGKLWDFDSMYGFNMYPTKILTLRLQF